MVVARHGTDRFLQWKCSNLMQEIDSRDGDPEVVARPRGPRDHRLPPRGRTLDVLEGGIIIGDIRSKERLFVASTSFFFFCDLLQRWSCTAGIFLTTSNKVLIYSKGRVRIRINLQTLEIINSYFHRINYFHKRVIHRVGILSHSFVYSVVHKRNLSIAFFCLSLPFSLLPFGYVPSKPGNYHFYLK